MNVYEDIQIDNYGTSAGEGGTASVVTGTLVAPRLVRVHGQDMRVAVKFIRSDAKSPEKEIEITDSFKYEVAIMCNLPSIPQIVKLIGYSESPRAIIMKYYPLSLKKLIDSVYDTGDPRICLKIMGDIATGMARLHKSGILHLDIKPRKCNPSKF